ncbi:hypothetical protein [Paenibacillus massiliensis]|uniref:hypothetical protein n=1 Tax=Paenibacillus massiliensis TaxID=225917 RepID=UPI000470C2AA|nr:hypothetical protein [Paenibacillus massiliensis]
MEKLIMYKDKFFFLRVVNFDKYDMEFGVYNLAGEYTGSTFYGIKEGSDPFSSEKEKEEFMEWIQRKSHEIEAEFKFMFEFFCPVEAANDSGFSAVEIMDTMQEKWKIPFEVMDAILP